MPTPRLFSLEATTSAIQMVGHSFAHFPALWTCPEQADFCDLPNSLDSQRCSSSRFIGLSYSTSLRSSSLGSMLSSTSPFLLRLHRSRPTLQPGQYTHELARRYLPTMRAATFPFQPQTQTGITPGLPLLDLTGMEFTKFRWSHDD